METPKRIMQRPTADSVVSSSQDSREVTTSSSTSTRQNQTVTTAQTTTTSLQQQSTRPAAPLSAWAKPLDLTNTTQSACLPGPNNTNQHRPSSEPKRASGHDATNKQNKKNHNKKNIKRSNKDQQNRREGSNGAAAAAAAAAAAEKSHSNNNSNNNKLPQRKKRKPTLKTMSIGDLVPTLGKTVQQEEQQRSSKTDPHTGHSSRKSAVAFKNENISNNQRWVGPPTTTPVVNTTLADFPALSSPTFVGSSSASDKSQSLSLTTNKVALENRTFSHAPGASSTNFSPAVAQRSTKQELQKPSTTTSSAAAFFSAAQRRDDEGGDEHQFFRLLQQQQQQLPAGLKQLGSNVVAKRGRQRLRPRKKKFTSLKKKVLEERLRKWREHNNIPTGSQEQHQQTDADSFAPSSQSVCLYGFVEPECLEDDDEYDELVENLCDMATNVAEFRFVFIPRALENLTTNTNMQQYPAFVLFETVDDARAAVSCWNGLTIGGQPIQAVAWNTERVMEDSDLTSTQSGDETAWQEACLAQFQTVTQATETSPVGGNREVSKGSMVDIILENVLSEEDLEDEECLEETLQDIKTMGERYGSVEKIRAEDDSRSIVISYRGGSQVARHAANEFGKKVISGCTIVARVLDSMGGVDKLKQPKCVVIQNALSEDDLEDEDCLEESLNDLRELAGQFTTDTVLSMEVVGSAVKITFEGKDNDSIPAVLRGFHGMVIGGLTLEAYSNDGERDEAAAEGISIGAVAGSNSAVEKVEPMYSGDKLIAERFAECKRVPKIPNTETPRAYAVPTNNESVKPLLVEMLGELMRLQKRAAEDKNAKAKRRLVMGLREVARGIRAHKIKMIVAANNVDEYGAIDEKIQEILDLAYAENIPVFFEFNKRGLGKAVGKTIKIAVVGVQNAEGAHQIFKKLARLQPVPK